MITVAVGIITDKSGRILLCLRPEGKPYARQWEFPGGKLEESESPEDCLRRELREELGIDAEVGPLFHSESHRYPDSGHYQVFYFLIPSFRGEIRNNVFADLKWVPAGTLLHYDNLEGNRAVIQKLMQRED